METMSVKNKTLQKFVSCLIIFAVFAPALFLSFKPNQTEAQNPIGVPVNDFTLQAHGWKAIAKEVLRQALMIAARRLLGQLTQSTVNWINTGNWGNPLFVENPSSFFKDIQKYEIRNLVDIYGYDSARFPYGRDFALNTIESYKRQAADNAAYSLSEAIQDPLLLRDYRNNFYVGGWNGFLINTQYQQNNYIGFQMLANEELARKLDGTAQNAAQKVNTALAQGQGFLSPQKCLSNPEYNKVIKNQFQRPRFDAEKEVPWNGPPVRYMGGARGEGSDVLDPEYEKDLALYNQQRDEFVAAAKAAWEKNNTCPGGLVSTTPGAVVGDQVKIALASKIHSTELAAAMGNSISAVLDALINKLIDTGLSSLSNKINPPPEPNPDDLEYFGDTVKGALDKAGQSVYTPPEPPPEETPPPGGNENQ